MFRWVSLVVATAVFASIAGPEGRSSQSLAGNSAATDLRGVWKMTELAWSTSDGGWEVRVPPYLSQHIFTERHYSYMYIPGAGPRKLFAGDPNRPTDAEKVEAYNSLVAASGTYSVSGQTLTLSPLIHKNPNEMTGKRLTYSMERDGNTLRLLIDNPPFLPGRKSRTTLTKVE